jgi:hypothetical protein
LPRSTVAFFILGCRVAAQYTQGGAPAAARTPLLRNFAASLQAYGFVLATRRTASILMVPEARPRPAILPGILADRCGEHV